MTMSSGKHSKKRQRFTSKAAFKNVKEQVDTIFSCPYSPDGYIDVLVDIVIYLTGADRPQFPLTWDVCSDFMTQLGMPVKVVPVDTA